jgi:hypothetical protein
MYLPEPRVFKPAAYDLPMLHLQNDYTSSHARVANRGATTFDQLYQR